jgi:hypothetical protein
MHPACKLCRGACCEFMLLPLSCVPRAERSWLEFHGDTLVPGVGTVALDVPCRMRRPDGRCAVYTTRPYICDDFEVGGSGCRFTIRRQRGGEQATEIEARLG